MNMWAKLPLDLLEAVASKLDSYCQYVWCRAVCKDWNTALPPKPRHHNFRPVPWLLSYNDDNDTVRSFYNLVEKKTYRLPLPEARNKVIIGSSFGWLVMLDKITYAMSLLEPFTHFHIDLPPLTSFPDVLHYDQNPQFVTRSYDNSYFTCSETYVRKRYIGKVVLSNNPSDNSNYVVVAIHGFGEYLAFCKHGDKSWTEINVAADTYCLTDVIFHQGKLYAISSHSEVVVWDLHSHEAQVYVEEWNFSRFRYLVAMPSGNIMIIERYGKIIDREIVTTQEFRILKFNIPDLNIQNQRMNYDGALLLGMNSSECLDNSIFAKSNRRCIYFGRDIMPNLGDLVDVGVYNLEDKTIQELAGCRIDGGIGHRSIWLLSCPFC